MVASPVPESRIPDERLIRPPAHVLHDHGPAARDELDDPRYVALMATALAENNPEPVMAQYYEAAAARHTGTPPPPQETSAVLAVLAGIVAASVVGNAAAGAVTGYANAVAAPMAAALEAIAETVETTLEMVLLAYFLTRALRRIAEAPDKPAQLDKERTYAGSQSKARDNRERARRIVQEMAAKHGNVLGWFAVRDAVTTADCRWAHGKNFYADRKPTIGYPGAVHVNCRCVPVPPWPGAVVMG